MTLTREQIDVGHIGEFEQWWAEQDLSAFKRTDPDDLEQIGVLHSWCKAAWRDALRSLDVGQAPKTEEQQMGDLASTLSGGQTEFQDTMAYIERLYQYAHAREPNDFFDRFASVKSALVHHWPIIRDALKTASEPNKKNAAVPNEVSVAVLEAERKALEAIDELDGLLNFASYPADGPIRSRLTRIRALIGDA